MQKRIILSAVLLLGLSLRLYGINFGLPYTYHADEPIIVNHAMAYGTGDLNPYFFAIPPLVSYILFIMYGACFLIGRALHIFNSPENFAISFLRDPTLFYLIARVFFGAILGSATIAAVYLLGKRLYSEKAGLLSALFFAVAFVHVQNSHYVYVDIAMVFFIVLTCLAVLGIVRTGSMKSYIVCGIFAGLATAAKYNASMVFIVVFFAHLYGNKPRGMRKIALAFCAMCATFIICNPYSILDIRNFIDGIVTQAGTASGLGLLYHLRYSLVEGLGLFLVFFGIAGILHSVIKKRKVDLILLSFPIIFYISLGFASQPHERYILPLVPFLSLYAAIFICENIKNIKLAVLLVVLIILPNLGRSIYSDYLFTQDDTRTIARRWIEENIKVGSRIAMEHSFFCPRLNQIKEQVEEKASTYDYADKIRRNRIDLAIGLAEEKKPYYFLFYLQDRPILNAKFMFESPQIGFSLSEIKNKGIGFVVLHTDAENAVRRGFLNTLENNATLVKEFSPYRDKGKKYSEDIIVQTGGPFLGRELFSRERNGYLIKIFKIKG